MSLIKEFKEFAIKGNVVDMAVGLIVGAAFGTIVKALVDNVLTPPLGLLLGSVDFSDLAITLKSAQGTAPAVLLRYGLFIQSIFNFLIVSVAVFALVKAINRLKRSEAAAPTLPPTPTQTEVLLTEIRDLLKK